MVNATEFPGGNNPTIVLTILAEMIIQIPPKHAAVPTLAEGILIYQTEASFHEGWQHNTSPSAYSCHHQHPSTSDGIVHVIAIRTPKGTLKTQLQIYFLPCVNSGID
jgi:hypothetical protein